VREERDRLDDPVEGDLRPLVELGDVLRRGGLEEAEDGLLGRQERRAQVADAPPPRRISPADLLPRETAAWNAAVETPGR